MGYRRSFVAGASNAQDRVDAEKVAEAFSQIRTPNGGASSLNSAPQLAQAFAAAGIEPRGSLRLRESDPSYSGKPTVGMADSSPINAWAHDDLVGALAALLAGSGNGGKVVSTYY